MLRVLRKKMKGILWITIASIIVTFIFYGARRGRGTSAGQFVGEIYGRQIPLLDYRRSLHWVRTMAFLQYGDRFKELEKFLNLEEEAWQNLLLLEYAKLAGIRVNNEELVSLIAAFPMFHKGGKFNSDTYRTVLQYALGITADYFENGMRDSLCISKVNHGITDGIKVTDQELRQHYRYMNEKVRAKYILFKSSDFEKDTSITETQIKDYFEDHRDEFRQPEKVKIQYVCFRPNPDDVQINESEIRDYYSKNTETYKDPKNPEKILPIGKVKDKIEEKLKMEKARERAEEDGEELLSLLEQGEKNWNELEITETDFLEKDSRVENVPGACINAAFAMETGETSSLVQTEKGFFILKLVDKKSSQLPPDHTQVAGKIEEKVRQVEAMKLAQSKAEKCLARLKEKKDPAAVAKEYSKEIDDTDFFSRLGYVKKLGMAPEFRRVAFSLTKDDPYADAPVPSGFCVLMFEERKGIDETKFQEGKEKSRYHLLAEKKQTVLADWLKLLKEEAQVRSDIGKQPE